MSSFLRRSVPAALLAGGVLLAGSAAGASTTDGLLGVRGSDPATNVTSRSFITNLVTTLTRATQTVTPQGAEGLAEATDAVVPAAREALAATGTNVDLGNAPAVRPEAAVEPQAAATPRAAVVPLSDDDDDDDDDCDRGACESCCGHEEVVVPRDKDKPEEEPEAPEAEAPVTTTPALPVAPAPTHPEVAAPEPELPRTGSTTTPWVLAGAGLLVVGGALVAVSTKGAALLRRRA